MATRVTLPRFFPFLPFLIISASSENIGSTITVDISTKTPATILYPPSSTTLIFNNIDTVEVTYETIWRSANMTLFCETNEDLESWVWKDFDLSMHQLIPMAT